MKTDLLGNFRATAKSDKGLRSPMICKIFRRRAAQNETRTEGD